MRVDRMKVIVPDSSNGGVRDCLVLTLIYCLAYGVLAVNKDGLVGDTDWIMYHADYSTMMATFRSQGNVMAAYVYHALMRFGGIWTLHFATFICYLGAGLLLYYLLRHIDFLQRDEAFIIAALAITFPNNEARFIACFVTYAYSFFAFMLAFFLMRCESIPARILSLTLFFVSFLINSLLVFYAVCMIYWAYVDRLKWSGDTKSQSAKNLCKWLLARLDFILLPLFYFAIRQTVWLPSGPMEGYNLVLISNIIAAFPKSLFAYHSAFIDLIDRAITSFTVLVPLLGAALAALRPLGTDSGQARQRDYLHLVLIGCLVFYLGAYPYFVVGKLLTSDNLGSRDQLLVALGAAWVLYFLIKYALTCRSSSVVPAVVYLIVALFVVHNGQRAVAYYIDSAKAGAVIEQLSTFEPVRAHRGAAFIFIDDARALNVDGRSHTWAELSGWMKAAYGDGSRLARSSDERISIDELRWVRTHTNIIDGYVDGSVVGTIHIRTRVLSLTTAAKLRIVLYKVFDETRYRNYLQSIGFVEVIYRPNSSF